MHFVGRGSPGGSVGETAATGDAASLAGRASAGQVLVNQSVVEAASPQGVTFVELEKVGLEGIARPVRVLPCWPCAARTSRHVAHQAGA